MKLPKQNKDPGNSNVDRGLLCTGLHLVMAGLLSYLPAAGAEAPDTFRLMAADDKFSNTGAVAFAYRTTPPVWLRTHHLEWSAGVLHSASNQRAFVAFGPVWRIEKPSSGWLAEVSIAPTFIAGSELAGRDLGGNVHFTSAVSAGWSFGQGWAISLRLQHISNGSLHRRNPGLDLIGLSVDRSFAE